MRVVSLANFFAFTNLSLFFLSLFLTSVEPARICVFSVVGFFKHRSAYDVLLESLVDKGHQVTVFSTLPLGVAGEHYKDKIRFLNPANVTAHLNSFAAAVSPLKWRQAGKPHVMWDMLPILTLDLCHIILQDEETRHWLRTEKKYDIFIVDSAWNECGISLAHALHAKLILFSFHSHLLSWNLDAFGAPVETSWVPDAQYVAPISESTFPLSFFQKLRSTFRSFRWHIYRNSYIFYQIRKFSRKFLLSESLDDFPLLRELEQNASLFLVNSHFSEEYARSLPPVFVSVGGVHIRTEESDGFKHMQQTQVVQKVQMFLSKSSVTALTSGFILVNLGCSKDIVTHISPDSFYAITRAIQKASEYTKFVFIWDTGDDEGKTEVSSSQNHQLATLSALSNVFVVDNCAVELNTMLAHSQIQGLISHGDLLDVQEAIYHAVPLILLPVAFEQDANAERVERLGRGIRLEMVTVTEDDLFEAVLRLTTNYTYKTNMKAASLIFRDRPLKPLDTAMWWIEYIIRNNGTNLSSSSLKPGGMYQTWYTRRVLDVWLFFFCTFSVIFVVIITLLAVLLFNQCKIVLTLDCVGCKRYKSSNVKVTSGKKQRKNDR